MGPNVVAQAICLMVLTISIGACSIAPDESDGDDGASRPVVATPHTMPSTIPEIDVASLKACNVSNPEFWLMRGDGDNPMLMGDVMLPSPAWRLTYDVSSSAEAITVSLRTRAPDAGRMDFQVMSRRKLGITLPMSSETKIRVVCQPMQ